MRISEGEREVRQHPGTVSSRCKGPEAVSKSQEDSEDCLPSFTPSAVSASDYCMPRSHE